MAEASQAFNQIVNTERTQTVIQGEDQKNIAGTVTATVTTEEPLPTASPLDYYTLVAEFRLVEGDMYVNAAYDWPIRHCPKSPKVGRFLLLGRMIRSICWAG